MPTMPGLPARRSRSGSRDASRGQATVIFAVSIVLFVSLCALVVDLSFYWVTTLRVQRAADAAALAGAVYLPGDKTTAYAEAVASATQNDYTGSTGVTVVPVQDSGDPRQLDVTITASSPAFFARVMGISSFPITRSSKGIYVLPVPMGSPLAYYGVGDFTVNKTTTSTANFTNASVPGYVSSPTSGAWSNPNNAWTTGASYSGSSTNNQAQQWTTLNIPSIGGATLDGLVLTFSAKVSAAASACQVKGEVSWDAGTTWNNASPALSTATLTTTATSYSLGSAASLSAWGNNHTWATGDFANSKFRVRLTYLKGASCGNLSLNTLVATVYSHTTTSTTTTGTTYGVNDGSTFLASQGSWGAILTKGGNEQNGDAYAPANNSGYSPANNTKYDPDGYHYAVSLPSGGSVKVFDPGFCAMGSNGVAGSLGAGDHWIGTTGTPVSTYYTLWDTKGKLGLPSAWSEVYTSGTLFEDQTGYDPANMGPNGTGSPPSGATDTCDANHNKWWTVPATLLGGTYVLQVQTTKTGHPIGGIPANADASKNNGTNAENMWSIEAAGTGAQVYGNGRMAVYNNLQVTSTPQRFYLAKIDQATGAGKTAQISLFDPGDLCGTCDGTLQVFSPDGGTSHAVTFSYTTDSNCVVKTGNSPCTGSNVSQIKTTTGGAQSFNNTWIYITIPLPGTYGQGGLWQGGWWQIVYSTPQGGNDTTTWEVSVSGNPVHLLVP
jgi:Flp pilus assembly protein TadG